MQVSGIPHNYISKVHKRYLFKQRLIHCHLCSYNKGDNGNKPDKKRQKKSHRY